MCFSTAKWKVERDHDKVQDHKFDFVDVNDFKQRNCVIRIKYVFVFVVVLKSVLVYIADLWTAGILLIFNEWSSSVRPKIPFYVSKWIFLGCIFMSYFLLALDMKKARVIIASGDISYAFTSVIAYRYYTLRSYAHYCFFSQINNSRKFFGWDNIAYFCFFTFKGWKRLLFAEAPRQAINAFTLYSIFESKKFKFNQYQAYGDTLVQRLAVVLMAFTLIIFIISASALLFAFLLYLPLLCHIRGNLKEYLCHKIDKRIGELLKKKSRKRVQQRKEALEAEAAGDYRHLKNKRGVLTDAPLREPTLPTLAFYGEKPGSSSLPVYQNAPPQPTLPFQQQPPPPIPYGDRKSPDPLMGYTGAPGGPRVPGYGGLPPYGVAAGQPPMQPPMPQFASESRRGSNDSKSSNYYNGQNVTTPLQPPPPKRSYTNLAAMQAAVTNNTSPVTTPPRQISPPNVQDYDEDPYGGTVEEDATSSYGETVYSSETLVTIRQETYDNTENYQQRNLNSYNNINNVNVNISSNNRGEYSHEQYDRYEQSYDQYDFRPPNPPRSGSPTGSVRSTNSGRGVRNNNNNNNMNVPSRYQQERSPRYNNYQGAKRGPGGY